MGDKHKDITMVRHATVNEEIEYYITGCCGSEDYGFEFGTKHDMCGICFECGEWAGLEPIYSES
jgi:hypothetical protein